MNRTMPDKVTKIQKTLYTERTHNQLRFAHQSVNKKKTAMTIDAILLAFVSNPHAIKDAPIKDEPR